MSQTPNRITPSSPPRPAAGNSSLREVIVDAVFQDGVFKPLSALDLPPGTPIQMRILTQRDAGQTTAAPPPVAAQETAASMKSPMAPAQRLPLPAIALGVALLGVLGFIVYRGMHASPVEEQAAPQTTAAAAPVAPLVEGAQLPAPEAELEIKLPALADGQPSDARDVAVDSQGNIYVASSGDGMIRKYDAKGALLASWGGPSVFKELFGVVIDRNDTVYALDAGVGSLLRFDTAGQPKGEPIAELAYFPRGLALAPNGEILIADTGGQRLVRINPADGTVVSAYGQPGEETADGPEPVDVVMRANGESYAYDARNNRIQRFGADGGVLSQWAVTGDIAARDGGHLALDRHDRLFYAVPAAGEITVYNSEGAILGTWPQTDAAKPTGVFADAQDNLYVTFPELGVVKKYKLPAAGEQAAQLQK